MGRAPYKYRIKLSGKEKRELRQAQKKGRTNARLVLRILIILWAAEGKTMARTAELLGICEQTVLNWRERFLERRSEGAVAALMDLPRSGRPVTYGAKEWAQVTAIVCETLKERQLPLSFLCRRPAPGCGEGRGVRQPQPRHPEPHSATERPQTLAGARGRAPLLLALPA